MPCQDPDADREELAVQAAKIHRLTKALCAQLRSLEAQGLSHLIHPSLRGFWQKHKEADERRRQAEERRLEQERQKRAAVAKLTPEERRLLGLRS